MLVHHADAEGDGIGRPGDEDGFAVDQDLAAIGLVKPAEDAHQGRFAGAVLSNDAGDRPRCDAERNVTVGVNRAKALVNMAKLDGKGTRGGALLETAASRPPQGDDIS